MKTLKMIIFMFSLMAFTFFAWWTVSNSKQLELSDQVTELESQVEVLKASNFEVNQQKLAYKQMLIDNGLIPADEATEEAAETTEEATE